MATILVDYENVHGCHGLKGADALNEKDTYHIWKRYPQYLRKQFWKEHTFWTDGYFACSVGNVSEEMLKRYIENQG